MDNKDLLERFHAYLAAFNSHSLLALKEYYDPKCIIVVDGETVAKDRNSMMVNYADFWAKMKKPVEAVDITPIKDGLLVILRDPNEGKDTEVEYIYNDKGLQVAHIVNGSK